MIITPYLTMVYIHIDHALIIYVCVYCVVCVCEYSCVLLHLVYTCVLLPQNKHDHVCMCTCVCVCLYNHYIVNSVCITTTILH